MGTYHPNYCYSINSGIPHTLKGWLRLDMQIYYFLRDFTSTPANEPLHFQDTYTMLLLVRISSRCNMVINGGQAGKASTDI